MLQLLIDFFYNLFDAELPDTNYVSDITINFGNSINYPGVMGLDLYLSLICSLISLIVIIILCCLFIKKIYNMCAHVIG